jgi:hypothetical protein
MFYACLLGALLGGAALALERVAALRRLSARWIWFGALVAACAVPVALALIPEAAPPAVGALSIGRMGPGSEESAVPQVAPRLRSRTGASLPLLTLPVLALWGSATTLLVGMLLHGFLMQRRDRRRWGRMEVDGIPVLVAPDAGPAVVGVRRLHIVLPEWALSGDPTALRLMLQHEEQHVRARDPNLLQIAAVLLVLMPWNLASWWLVRRLRLAVEVDCDGRVLRLGEDAHAYGTLLVDVGARYAAAVLLPGAAFSESSSHLARRIEAMTAPSPRRPLLRACALGTVAAAAILVACAAPRPEPIRPAAAPDRIFSPLAVRRPRAAPEQPFARWQMTAALARYFPEVLRGDTGTMPIRFVLDTDGRVLSTSRGPVAPSSVIPFDRLEFVRTEDVGPGYYAPTSVQLEVQWMKPDSLIGEIEGPGRRGPVLSTFESTGPGAESASDRANRMVLLALGGHSELVGQLRSDDTAYVWLVFSAAGNLVRSGRVESQAAIRQAFQVESPASGYYRNYVRGEIAPGVVVVGAVWEKP